MTCDAHSDGRHQLTICDDPECHPKGYVERCVCGAELGNAGRARRRLRRPDPGLVGVEQPY